MPEAFINRRVKVTLHDATLLRRGDLRTHHFRLSMNLSEEGSLLGLAEWIQNNYTLMQKATNRIDNIKSKTKLDNMSIGFYSTERTRSKFFSQVVAASLSKFKMERKGDGDEDDVWLFFSAYFPGRREIHDWTYDHKAADLWMDFEQQQGELSLDGEQGKEADELDGGDEDFEDDDHEGDDDDDDQHPAAA